MYNISHSLILGYGIVATPVTKISVSAAMTASPLLACSSDVVRLHGTLLHQIPKFRKIWSPASTRVPPSFH